MKTRSLSDQTLRDRENYRCAHCGKFIAHDTDGFFDREDRESDSSPVLVFCDERHADAYHAK